MLDDNFNGVNFLNIKKKRPVDDLDESDPFFDKVKRVRYKDWKYLPDVVPDMESLLETKLLYNYTVREFKRQIRPEIYNQGRTIMFKFFVDGFIDPEELKLVVKIVNKSPNYLQLDTTVIKEISFLNNGEIVDQILDYPTIHSLFNDLTYKEDYYQKNAKTKSDLTKGSKTPVVPPLVKNKDSRVNPRIELKDFTQAALKDGRLFDDFSNERTFEFNLISYVFGKYHSREIEGLKYKDKTLIPMFLFESLQIIINLNENAFFVPFISLQDQKFEKDLHTVEYYNKVNFAFENLKHIPKMYTTKETVSFGGDLREHGFATFDDGPVFRENPFVHKIQDYENAINQTSVKLDDSYKVDFKNPKLPEIYSKCSQDAISLELYVFNGDTITLLLAFNFSDTIVLRLVKINSIYYELTAGADIRSSSSPSYSLKLYEISSQNSFEFYKNCLYYSNCGEEPFSCLMSYPPSLYPQRILNLNRAEVFYTFTNNKHIFNRHILKQILENSDIVNLSYFKFHTYGFSFYKYFGDSLEKIIFECFDLNVFALSKPQFSNVMNVVTTRVFLDYDSIQGVTNSIWSLNMSKRAISSMLGAGNAVAKCKHFLNSDAKVFEKVAFTFDLVCESSDLTKEIVKMNFTSSPPTAKFQNYELLNVSVHVFGTNLVKPKLKAFSFNALNILISEEAFEMATLTDVTRFSNLTINLGNLFYDSLVGRYRSDNVSLKDNGYLNLVANYIFPNIYTKTFAYVEASKLKTSFFYVDLFFRYRKVVLEAFNDLKLPDLNPKFKNYTVDYAKFTKYSHAFAIQVFDLYDLNTLSPFALSEIVKSNPGLSETAILKQRKVAIETALGLLAQDVVIDHILATFLKWGSNVRDIKNAEVRFIIAKNKELQANNTNKAASIAIAKSLKIIESNSLYSYPYSIYRYFVELTGITASNTVVCPRSGMELALFKIASRGPLPNPLNVLGERIQMFMSPKLFMLADLLENTIVTDTVFKTTETWQVINQQYAIKMLSDDLAMKCTINSYENNLYVLANLNPNFLTKEYPIEDHRDGMTSAFLLLFALQADLLTEYDQLICLSLITYAIFKVQDIGNYDNVNNFKTISDLYRFATNTDLVWSTLLNSLTLEETSFFQKALNFYYNKKTVENFYLREIPVKHNLQADFDAPLIPANASTANIAYATNSKVNRYGQEIINTRMFIYSPEPYIAPIPPNIPAVNYVNFNMSILPNLLVFIDSEFASISKMSEQVLSRGDFHLFNSFHLLYKNLKQTFCLKASVDSQIYSLYILLGAFEIFYEMLSILSIKITLKETYPSSSGSCLPVPFLKKIQSTKMLSIFTMVKGMQNNSANLMGMLSAFGSYGRWFESIPQGLLNWNFLPPKQKHLSLNQLDTDKDILSSLDVVYHSNFVLMFNEFQFADPKIKESFSSGFACHGTKYDINTKLEFGDVLPYEIPFTIYNTDVTDIFFAIYSNACEKYKTVRPSNRYSKNINFFACKVNDVGFPQEDIKVNLSDSVNNKVYLDMLAKSVDLEMSCLNQKNIALENNTTLFVTKKLSGFASSLFAPNEDVSYLTKDVGLENEIIGKALLSLNLNEIRLKIKDLDASLQYFKLMLKCDEKSLEVSLPGTQFILYIVYQFALKVKIDAKGNSSVLK